MARILAIIVCLAVQDVTLAQPQGALRISVTLRDATQAATPIAGHALLISDNPPSRTPRRIVTAADGTVVVQLAPGSYVVESDRPVGFHGTGYQWVAFVEVAAGPETVLALTAENAEIVPVAAEAPETPVDSARDAPSEIEKWRASVVTIWSPTTQASGFVVGTGGLIATDRNAVGTATSVEVQLSPTVKVPGRVLVAGTAQDVAIVWIDPGVLEQVPPVPLSCPATTPVETGDEIAALAASLRRGENVVSRGEITGFHPRGIETDLRLSFGEAGGPAFAADETAVIGLTSFAADDDARRGDVRVVRAGIVCEAISAARSRMAGATPPEPTLLRVEPTDYARTDVVPATAETVDALPPVVTSDNFDVAFITPVAVQRARARADRTGGRSARTPEAEARLGRLTDFGAWADYFADAPPVLVVRVTPKLVEGFWMRLAREAARVQGAALPPLKDFKTSFLRMRAPCGGVELPPIHPFVLEHAAGKGRVLREGLYVFGAEDIGPHCSELTFSVVAEQEPGRVEIVRVDAKVAEQIWQDFAAYRKAGQ